MQLMDMDGAKGKRPAQPDESRKRRRPADQQTTIISRLLNIIPGTDVP